MNYTDIVNNFKLIENVRLIENEVIVSGVNNNDESDEVSYTYKYSRVARAVAEKVEMFIGI